MAVATACNVAIVALFALLYACLLSGPEVDPSAAEGSRCSPLWAAQVALGLKAPASHRVRWLRTAQLVALCVVAVAVLWCAR